jgi:glycosyltransferase involved in cell wall biosynthesis
MRKEERGFVCGFYGARDGYEVPVALEEAGLLELLVTDFYGSAGWLGQSGLVRAARKRTGLPPQKVRGSLLLSCLRHLTGRCFRDEELQNHLTDSLLSRRMARAARKRDANIFAYEPYAVRRPSGGFPNGRKQIVFYYHPHVDTEDAIYRGDQQRFPEFYQARKVTDSRWRRRTADAWKQADLVVCASSFTKQSLVSAGMPEERGIVVPYGTTGLRHEARGGRSERQGAEVRCQRSEDGGRSEDREQKTESGGCLLATSNSRPATGSLRLLFVGRNPLRKGLHHLLMAWNAAQKAPGDLLTVICAAKPAELQRLAEGRQDVRWLASVSAGELGKLYAESDALVVPSLCEGFGHVYLEAMGLGCAVVGTRNSALPDIGDENQGVFTVDVGDVEGLARLISRASADALMFRGVSEVARQRSGEFTWEGFRNAVRTAVAAVA